MRTLIDLIQEKEQVEKILEGKDNKADFRMGKAMGESVQLQIIHDDCHELLEWIKGHTGDTVPKKLLVTKIQGETIG